MKQIFTHILIAAFSITCLHATLPDCHADFNVSIDGYTATFTDDSETETGDISYSWTFGDGGTSDAASPVHEYAAPGSYTVCLVITTAGGCIDDRCETIVIGGGVFCNADFEFTVDGLTVHFFEGADAEPGEVSSFSWDLGDGTETADINPTHTYAEPGIYTVCLTIVTTDGCEDFICYEVAVGGAGAECAAEFTFSPDGLHVLFTDVSDAGPGDVISWSWNFGDGTESTEEDPDHTYAAAGTYTVCLTIITSEGCIDDYCHPVTVPDGDCHGYFDILGYDGNMVHVFGWTEPEADIVTYTWNWGDGTTTTETGTGAGTDPWHEYPGPGTYTVCLSIETGIGCMDMFCETVVIGGGDCISDFEYSTDGLTAHFFETATGDIATYAWDFGDGGTGDAANPLHTYDTPGIYTVCLTITTVSGCESTYCMDILVDEATGDCASDFEYTVDGYVVHFYETADGGGADIIEYFWNFGDGSISTEPNPVHEFGDADYYIVCLTITTADGCYSTFCDEVTPDADGGGDCDADYFIASMELTPDGWLVHLENTSTADADITAVVWTFGDGTMATTYDAEHVYLEPGEYLICVVISTADGCTSEYCDHIFVGGDTGECEADFTDEESGLTVYLTEDADGAGADIISYIWTFDDGTIGYGTSVEHTYMFPGEYEVCLTIITSDSCIDTHCEDIHVEGVSPDCIAGFEVGDIVPDGGGWELHFINTSDGTGDGSDTYMWTFGDGGISDAVNPAHFYTEPGIYTVCVTIGEEGLDCFDTYCEEIFIGDPDDCIDEGMIDTTVDCIAVYEPVCGCDGVTYENACVAMYHHGIVYYTSGPCGGTGIEEENILNSLEIAPNPSSYSARIQYQVAVSSEVRIYVHDITGKLIYSTPAQYAAAGRYAFVYDTSGLSDGVYFIQIAAGNDVLTGKLIVSR